MYNIKLVNKIAKVGIDVFDTDKYNVSEDAAEAVALMVRSAKLHDTVFDKETIAIARAGAGVNNIPCERCADEGIVVFNTPGANANGVKELTVSALLLAARDIVGGIAWAEELEADGQVAAKVEKGKSRFAGSELMGKTIGVIGLGAIGGLVANACVRLGMKVIGYDPHLSVTAAWNLSGSIIRAESYDDIYTKSDYISLHIPALPTTKGMINAEAIAKMKKGVKIINLARGELVNIPDLKDALASGAVSKYVTDFPSDETLGTPGIINIPHLGASTEESEDNCAVMAANQLCEYIEYGNIKNSVNYPAVAIPPSATTEVGGRIGICHKNIANMIAGITGRISATGLNIEHMANGSRGEYAYTLIETTGKIPESVAEAIRIMDGIISVRII
ncbi:MAG: 3-phosphoglycerate dehydrogenase [Ruminococcaceae bacterium]|nr:3-phosphoglycerate dehydrogenase [Oscillospiraceae bacterium]